MLDKVLSYSIDFNLLKKEKYIFFVKRYVHLFIANNESPVEIHGVSNLEVGIFELVFFGTSLLKELESDDTEFRQSLGLSVICANAGVEVCSAAQLPLLLLLRNNGDKLEDEDDIFS